MERKRTRINWQLLIKVATGKASGREQELFDAWISEAPEQNRQIFEEVRYDVSTDKHITGQPTDKFTAYARVLKKIRQNREEAAAEWKPVSHRPWRRVAAIAASIILLIGAGLGINNLYNPENHLAKNNTPLPELEEIQVDFGRMVKMTLSDGSVIRLAPGTKFKYPRKFSEKERRVYLQGEAFFEVTRDTLSPFIVQTSDLETRVLGTSFNIEAFEDHAVTKIMVATGKVSVSRNTAHTQPQLLAYLTPHRQIEFNSINDSFRITELSENVVSAVKNGKLAFDGTPLKEIAESLARRYGIGIHFQDKKMEEMLLTIMLEYRSIEYMTDMLALATHLEVRHHEGHLYFRRK